MVRISLHPLPSSPSAAAMQKIVTWSVNLPPWQRDALRRLCQQDQLTDQDLIDAVELCLGPHQSHSAGPAKSPQPLTISHVRHDPRGQVVALKKMKEVANVNALADGQILKFSETGLTIVFGGNATGKSGYTRVLKKACRARAANTPILPNVYVPPPGTPASCKLEYSIGGSPLPANWTDGGPTDNALSAISVFDSACAIVHVEKTNDVAYTPAALQLLARLADLCLKVRARLTSEQQTLQGSIPASLVNPKCRTWTKVGELADSLFGSTDISGVKQLADLSEDERKRAQTLRAHLANDPRKAAEQLRLSNQRLLQHISKIDALRRVVDDGAAIAFKQVVAESIAKTEAARIAAEELFNKEPLPSVGTETWQVLWEAARKYSEADAYKGQPFPVTGEDAKCVLCQQELQPEGASRLNRFEAFVREKTQTLAHEANLKVESDRRVLQAAKLTHREQRDAVDQVDIEFENTSLAAELRRFLVTARWRHRLLLRASLPDDWPELLPLPSSPLAALTALTAERTDRIKELQNSANLDARRRLELEIQELEDRAWLASVLDDVRLDIQRRKKLAVLDSAIHDTDTRNITTKSTALAETLVTTALRDRFADELNRLGMGRLRIELVRTTSEYGVPKFKVSLIASPSAEVGTVLSEGEHRCIALAGFLSELATADDQSGIVFDDPVSSLDHDYRQLIAKRLVEESQHRQVIAFTHDIVFLTQLAEQARKLRVTPFYQSVARGDDRTGFCSSEPPMKLRPVLDALDGLQKLLNRVSPAYASGHLDDWWRETKSIAGNLRDLWERAVEQALSPVYSRYDYGVDTKGLIKVTVLTDTDCRVMRAAFGRCSTLQHSEPSAVGSAAPTPSNLQNEIDELKNWMTDVLNRQDAVS